MDFHIIIDNYENPLNKDLKCEHGLSICFEYQDKLCMVDCGASSKFYDNAVTMGIDISKVDYLILSHAHNDHTGGVSTFLQYNSKATIFFSEYSLSNRYYSSRGGEKRDVGFREELFRAHLSRFCLVKDNDIEIMPGLMIMVKIPIKSEMPKANETLYINNEHDSFIHEIALCIDSQNGGVVISSCSHRGVVNTLQQAKTMLNSSEIIAYIGGCHLPNGEFETEDDIANICQKIAQISPKMTLYTGHCTENTACSSLKQIMGEQFQKFYSGFSVSI